MKKILSTLFMALISVAMMAQEPIITFETTEYDFGKINEADGRVSTTFTFKNEGMTPLVLSNVRASCGCTTPTWTKEPIEPGQSGTIIVTYNPNGRPGRFQKTVTITSNAREATCRVYIKGEVIPKQAKPSSNTYSVAIGDINVRTKTMDLGDIKKGEFASRELEYANFTQNDHTVELATSPADNFLINQVTLPTVKPNEVGKLFFSIDTKKVKLYGPFEVYAYVVVDGKKELNDTYKLTIKANVVEDFSQLSEEEKLLGPKVVVDNAIDLGKVAQGKTLKGQISLLNVGVNPLQIRRVYTQDGTIVFKPCKSIKSGKKGVINVEIPCADRKVGHYSRQVTIITNDPQQSQKRISLHWTIE